MTKHSSLSDAIPSPVQREAQPYRFARRMSRMTVSAVREILKVTEQPEIISFAGGMPAPELFPVAQIAQAHEEVFREEGPAALQYSTTEGWRPLREWIARRLRAQGISADASRLLITSGSQQGIDLVGKIFLDPGDAVLVENPCYLAALQSFSGHEASFVGVDSDDQGMKVDQIERALAVSQVRLIYLVPDFQNPKGTTLSIERREQLIDISRRHRIPILEDDPYGELRYRGTRPDSLAALDKDGLVIRLSTFSKTLSPGIRIGWISASEEILQTIVIAKQAADLHTSTIEQRAAARLLQSFDYDAHVSHLCEVYGKRCDAMLKAMETYFPAQARWTKPDGGLFIWVELPDGVNAEEAFKDAIRERVAFVPGTSFFAKEPERNFIRLNFSNQVPEMIEEGIKRIGNLLKRRIK
ncbi:MAG: PLP-dependent aminotransferase family protein [Blastocatellia bacterium]